MNGNYLLSEIRVQAAPADRSSGPTAVTLQQPIADYSQTSYGGWPVGAALDGQPATAWSMDPAEGRPHAALFHTVSIPDAAGDTELTVELVQGDREHTLGRFRLWATASAAPALPTGYGIPAGHVAGEIPATRCGGLLVVVVELSQHGQPVEVRNLGSALSAEAELDGKPVTFVPTLGQEGYPSPWQAWRYPIEAGASAQPLALRIMDGCAESAERRFSAYFLPEQR